MEFHILASGSKGNATFIYENHTGILIDCGISKRQLLLRLKESGYSEEDIHYVLLTHDHSDHNKNIKIFDKDILYTTKGNVEKIDAKHTIIPYHTYQLGDFSVFVLRTSHDASDPVGFIIEGEETLVYMTDTGYVSDKNRSYMHNKDYYIIEANHDIEMLMNTNRPLFLKQRILSDTGHLNNEYSAYLMSELLGDNTKEIYLAHLSEDANTKETALNTYYTVFNENNVDFNYENIQCARQRHVVHGGHYED